MLANILGGGKEEGEWKKNLTHYNGLGKEFDNSFPDKELWRMFIMSVLILLGLIGLPIIICVIAGMTHRKEKKDVTSNNTDENKNELLEESVENHVVKTKDSEGIQIDEENKSSNDEIIIASSANDYSGSEKILFCVKGKTRKLVVFEDYVKITTSTAGKLLDSPDMELYWIDITSVSFSKGNGFTNGSINLLIPMQSIKPEFAALGQVFFSAKENENAQKAFEYIHSKVREIKLARQKKLLQS